LAPALVGRDPRDIDALNRLLDVTLPGHPYAKSPLDMALWDLLGQSAGLPLYALFGGAEGGTVPVSSSISTGTPQDMAALVEAARAEGYRVHSAKIGGTDPALDIARIEAIEAARRPDEEVTYDINRAWTPALAIEVMNAVAPRGWFEQPCETLDQCAHVRRHTRQPIMLDECLHGFHDHLVAWKMAACEGVKVKPNRLGGLTKARRARDLGVAVGWRMHLEDVGGTVIADTAALHLALSTPAENRLASWLCHPHLVDDPAPRCRRRRASASHPIRIGSARPWQATGLPRHENG
jgi:L-alanine-DL-glutamate epimerase-like enolase superfamily enzyme